MITLAQIDLMVIAAAPRRCMRYERPTRTTEGSFLKCAALQKPPCRKTSCGKARATLRVLRLYAALKHLCICNKNAHMAKSTFTENPGLPARQKSRRAIRAGPEQQAEDMPRRHSGNAHAKRPPGTVPASLNLPTVQEDCMGSPRQAQGPEKPVLCC